MDHESTGQRHDVDNDTASDIAARSIPVQGYMIGRVAEWKHDEDGIPESMDRQMLVYLETADDSYVIARFSLDAFREFTAECHMKIDMFDRDIDDRRGNER